MFVKIYKLIDNKNVYQKTIYMKYTIANMRMICNTHYDEAGITMHVTGIHNQAKYIRYSYNYKKIKI